MREGDALSLPKGWEIKTWNEVLEIRSGRNQKDVLNPEGKYPIMGSAGKVMGYANSYLCDEGTTIVGRKGTIDKPLYIESKFWNVDTAFGLVAGEKLDKKYLYNFCLSYDFKTLDKGTTLPSLVKKDLIKIIIPIPPIEEQKQIVVILDKAFTAIDQAKANIEKNIVNAKELFQSKLNDIFSQKGDGWENDKMVNVCSMLTCGVASTPKYVDETIGVAFLSAQNVKNGKVILHKYKFISQEFHKHLTKKNKPQKGDILYSRVGAKYGEAGVVEHDFDFSVYVSLTLIRPLENKLNNYYLKYYLNSPLIKNLAKLSITSSGVPNLNVKSVREFPVHYPNLKEQLVIINKIEKLEFTFLEITKKYKQKVNSLEELKKSLLQKAFAGELTQKEVVV